MNTPDTTWPMWRNIGALMVLPRQYAQGRTLLLVEDSHVASDAIRLMFRGAAARLRRVDTLRAARRHLELYTPDAVIVDIGLPDGCGLDLVRMLDRRRPRVALVVATSGQPEMEGLALDAGADHFLAKPVASMARFRDLLAPVFFDLWHQTPAGTSPRHDPAALRDDVHMACDLLRNAGCALRRGYALQFTEALGRSLHDDTIIAAVAGARESGAVANLVLLLRQRLREQPMI
ncbi:response regulator [Roseinatronobacter alkalisoli]|uniref:Response regulator n=1 Tax=Roseinatronobacter alkalisoli TaxID=3028235 RepID=A0ABT5T4G7_9RHOB|nr:response regulator [Roseinatronobacter sp. HJB301]MDD7970016.1 response regulator [Roseinatronobacter sp. HJB301]